MTRTRRTSPADDLMDLVAIPPRWAAEWKTPANFGQYLPISHGAVQVHAMLGQLTNRFSIQK